MKTLLVSFALAACTLVAQAGNSTTCKDGCCAQTKTMAKTPAHCCMDKQTAASKSWKQLASKPVLKTPKAASLAG